MAKIKLNDIKSAEISFSKLFDSIFLPLTMRISLAPLVDVVDHWIDNIEKQRVKLIFKYGKINKKTGKREIPEDKIGIFDTETESMLAKEIEIPECFVSFKELLNFDEACKGKYANNRLTARDISNLKFLFNYNENEEDSSKNKP